MTEHEIMLKLCYNDPRHPDYDPEVRKSEDCYCDNCFYGRHKLADYILKKFKEIRTNYSQYQFFLEGYRNGSASFAEVNVAHDEFIKSLE